MNSHPLEIKQTIQVSKPANEVFEAIVDPAKMTGYFIADSSGRMEDGKKLTWHFPEFSMDIAVMVLKTEKTSISPLPGKVQKTRNSWLK